jgi:formylglycine-generating enzyme required for sulfatase activity
MKLYDETPRGARLTLDRYSERLRVGRSLNSHAQWIYDNSLTAPQKKLAEKVFRALTTTEDGREVRRPNKLGVLYTIIGAQSEDERARVRAVIREFAKKENSLLFSSMGDNLTDDTRVDITHESLIRQWDLLKEWVRREAESADWFARLVRSAELRREAKGGGGLWPKPDTEFAFRRMSEEGWTAEWGDQYRPGFSDAVAFLGDSRAAIEAVEENERRARERELQAARDLAEAKQRELTASRRGRNRLIVALGGLAAATLGLLYFVLLWRIERQQRIEALQNQLTAVAAATRINKVDGLRYAYIPPGKFTMGCSPGDAGCFDNETPPHEVEITRGFWMGQTEATQAAYEKLMKTNPSSFKGADRPVESVSWDQAKAFCEAAGLRLPTEAEWEYAARAGSKESRYGALDQVGWYGSNSKGQTQPVAAKSPNAWGLYDMLGNVWEWTADWYDKDYYNQKVAKDPPGSEFADRSKSAARGLVEQHSTERPRLVPCQERAFGPERQLRFSLCRGITLKV